MPGGRGELYRAVKKQEVEKHAKIKISQALSNNETETKFLPQQILFKDIKNILKDNKAWSPSTFRSNYRKNENVILQYRMCVYDIDNNMSLQEAINLLEAQKIHAIIATTKSHQKEKKGVTCDRFRIVIPLLYEWTPETPQTYRRDLKTMAKKIGLPVDQAATDAARFYYGNPEAQIYEVEGQAVDISTYHEAPEVRKTYTPDMTIRSSQQSDEGIQAWFVRNTDRYGGRNATLFQVALFYMSKKGMDREQAHKKVLEVNKQFPQPLSEIEIQKTIFITKTLDEIDL
jgi:hypothetical protein